MRVRFFDIQDVSRLTPAGSSRSFVKVAYYIGDHGPFYEEFEKDKYSIHALMDAIEKIKHEVESLINGL